MTDTAEQLRLRAESAERALIEAVRQRDMLAAALSGSISEWCFPWATELPDSPKARCEWYARRLLVIANSAKSALQSIQA